MRFKLQRLLLGAAIFWWCSTAIASTALATEGYFQLGFGPRQNALGGAGAADSRDANAFALNPAGIVGLQQELQIGVAAFAPYRSYEATGLGFVAPGEIHSGRNLFGIPNLSITKPIDELSSFGLALYGGGGMNTAYSDVANPACGGGSGVFCSGKAGGDLIQAFISAGYARNFDGIKMGIAPTFVMQRFKADGLAALSGVSSDPTNLTNRGYDYSYGVGIKGGLEVELEDGLRIGLAGQSKMYMSRFDKYAGLFENQGDFDIPAAITAGLAFDISPDATLLFDYQHIFYGNIKSIANSSSASALLGSKDGPGFGWHDIDVLKFGAEWRANDHWTLRAGYAYSENPIRSSDVTFNILAPGVVKHHYTGGVEYQFSEKDSIELSGMYVPESNVSGIELTPSGPNPGRTISLKMHQVQLLVGWSHNF